MRFSGFLALSMATLATAAGDPQPIINSINTIIAGVKNLDNQLNKYTKFPDIIGALPVLQASIDLQNEIKSADGVVKKSQPLDDDGALSIAQAVIQPLNDAVNKTLTDFINAKPLLQKQLLQGLVLDQLKKQQADTTTLINDLKKKIPSDLQTVTTNLVQPILDGFKKAIAVYSKFF